MKIYTLPLLAVVALSPLTVMANSQDLTATGRVQLAKPSEISEGSVSGKTSNVNFRSVVRGTTGAKINSGDFKIDPAASLTTAGRIANKQILESVVGDAKGYRLVMVYQGNLSPSKPLLYAYKPAKGSTPADLKAIDPSKSAGLEIDFGWLNFDGTYRGSGVVSTSVSGTASSTSLISGRLRGFTDFFADLNLQGKIIPMSGVGSFDQKPQGITGSANVSGVYVP